MKDIACSAGECRAAVQFEQCLDYWTWEKDQLITFSQLFHLATYLNSANTVSYYLVVHCLIGVFKIFWSVFHI